MANLLLSQQTTYIYMYMSFANTRGHYMLVSKESDYLSSKLRAYLSMKRRMKEEALVFSGISKRYLSTSSN